MPEGALNSAFMQKKKLQMLLFVCLGSLIEELLIALEHIIGRKVEKVHLLEDIGQNFVNEEVLAQADDDLASSLRDKVADATLVVDNLQILQIFVGAHHGVGVDLDQSGVGTDGRDALFFGIVAQKDFVHDAVGYLQEDGFGFFEVHERRNLWSVICEWTKIR